MSSAGKSLLVNALTFSRVPLIFAWCIAAIVAEFTSSMVSAAIACAMMLLSGLTDAWDGDLARKWGVVSTLGKMADPLMDKVFYLVAFPALTWLSARQGQSAHSLVLLTVTILYLLRDTWVTFLRSVGAMYGADVGAMMLGKVRTAISFPGAGWVYVYLTFRRLPIVPASWQLPWLVSTYVVEGVLVVLTLWSLITYSRAYSSFLKRSLESK